MPLLVVDFFRYTAATVHRDKQSPAVSGFLADMPPKIGARTILGLDCPHLNSVERGACDGEALYAVQASLRVFSFKGLSARTERRVIFFGVVRPEPIGQEPIEIGRWIGRDEESADQ